MPEYRRKKKEIRMLDAPWSFLEELLHGRDFGCSHTVVAPLVFCFNTEPFSYSPDDRDRTYSLKGF
jgi:hypothetical protein